MRQTQRQRRNRSRKRAARLGRSTAPAVRPWQRPTFGEFLAQLEHEFGGRLDTSVLLLAGMGRNERLEPSDIEALCSQIGLPAEDFGVGP
ncbi:MAG: hypothetical protein GWP16_01555 [Nitrospirae bacterium]|nr:hypothetical protein [Nitrospirota bacterium]